MRTLADYTANDLTAPHSEADQQRYARHVERWQTELHPVGTLECWFAAEIVRAVWRLERFEPLGPQNTPETTTTDERNATWLRYRDRTSTGIRRNLEELRRIQSDRHLQSHLGIHLPGVASLKYALPNLRQPKEHREQPPVPDTPDTLAPTPAAIERTETILDTQIQEESLRQYEEFRKENPDPEPEPEPSNPAPLTKKAEAARNAPCPCGSGQKYKRCCGHWSKTPLPHAA